MEKLLLISSSLNPSSRSYVAMKKVEEISKELDYDTKFLDLRDHNLPFCDGRKFEEYDQNLVKGISKHLQEANYIVFGMPVYCYSLSGVLKNFIDIFAHFMGGKKFGVLEQAGTKLSYLAANDIQKIIGFECESQPIFPVVLTDYSSFTENTLTDEKSIEKIYTLLNNFRK